MEEGKHRLKVSVLRYNFLNLRSLTFDSETVFEELLCSLCDISQHRCPFPTKQYIPSQLRTSKMSPAIAKCLPGASKSPSDHQLITTASDDLTQIGRCRAKPQKLLVGENQFVCACMCDVCSFMFVCLSTGKCYGCFVEFRQQAWESVLTFCLV